MIIETCLLTDEEKVLACQQAMKAKATFVKTSTGFSTGGATVHDVEMCIRDSSEVIARWTGIPIHKLMESEREKLLHLDDILRKRVIGQDEAIEKICDAILRLSLIHI